MRKEIDETELRRMREVWREGGKEGEGRSVGT